MILTIKSKLLAQNNVEGEQPLFHGTDEASPCTEEIKLRHRAGSIAAVRLVGGGYINSDSGIGA